MCGAKGSGPDLIGDATTKTIIQGFLTRDCEPVTGYVQLLDNSGEFTAEVPTSKTGQFRFFAAPGQWTLRILAPNVITERTVVAQRGELTEIAIAM
jgi:hypothetical protein